MKKIKVILFLIITIFSFSLSQDNDMQRIDNMLKQMDTIKARMMVVEINMQKLKIYQDSVYAKLKVKVR